jgi:hypothetical protein
VTSEDDHSVTRTQSRCVCQVTNCSSEELTIPKGTILVVAEEISEPLVDGINAGNGSESGLMTSQQRKRRNMALNQKLLQGKLDHLSKEERELIEPVLLEYSHVFHDEESTDFKGTNVIEHRYWWMTHGQ